MPQSLADISSLLGYFSDRKVHHLVNCVIRWQYRFCFGELSQLAMIRFYCVGGINQVPNLLWILKKGSQFCPIIIPRMQNWRIFPIPYFPKLFFCILGVIKVHRAVNLFQVGTDGFSVFIRYKLSGIADLPQPCFFRQSKHVDSSLTCSFIEVNPLLDSPRPSVG